MREHPRFPIVAQAAGIACLVLAVLVGVPALGAQEAEEGFPLSLTPPPDLDAPPADAEVSPSGLASKVLSPGDGDARPDGNDLVNVHYIGWTPEGEMFDSSRAKPKGAVFNLAKVFSGWREGISLMVPGETRRLWIPEHLAPPNPTEGPRGAVVFDVYLRTYRSIPDLPASFPEPAPGAERLPNGVYTEVVEAGEGDEHPKPDSLAWLHYTAWTADGVSFDSTHQRGRPTLMPLDKVLPAFAEAVQRMVPGERRRIWIPGNVAAGQWSGSPQGDLFFDVTLLGITEPGEAPEIPPPAPPGSDA